MKYRLVNTDIRLQVGRDCETFKEAVQMRARILGGNPAMRIAIVDIK